MMQSHLVSLLQKKSLVILLYVFTSAYVFGIWVWSADTPTTSFNGDPRSKLSDLIYGTAHKPYVQRAIIPILTRTIYMLAPPTWESLERQLLAIPKVRKESVRLGWEEGFLAEYVIALVLAFACLCGFAFTARELWRQLYDAGEEIVNAVPLITLLCLPPIFPTGPHYIYDFPSLFFFTLGFALMLRQQWTYFAFVFAVGCLNKETMLLLTFAFFLLYRNRLSKRELVSHLIWQLAIFAMVKSAIQLVFSPNPGTALDFHLYGNLHLLLMGYSWTSLFLGAVVGGLIVYDLKTKHPSLKTAALLIIPFGALVLWGGVITELRALYELYPIFLFLALHTILFSFLQLPFSLKHP